MSDIHEDEQKLINDMAEGNAQDSQIQNIVFYKTESLFQDQSYVK